MSEVVQRGPWGYGDDGGRGSRLRPLRFVDPTSLQGLPVPEIKWLIPGVVPCGQVVMMSGDGATGKSTLCQQLMTAAATCQPWLGLETGTDPIPALGFFCEDSDDILHWRQSKMNEHYGIDMQDLSAMRWLSRDGDDNELMQFPFKGDSGGKETPLFHQLATMIRTGGYRLIVIDTVGDTFGGNENIKNHARKFVGAMRKLAQINDGGVILTSHPSLTGMSSGSGMSGNVGWNNSVRARMYLTKPKLTQDEDGEDSGERSLRLMKSNYTRSGNTFKLRWANHVFVSDETTSGGVVHRLDVDHKVLEALRWYVKRGERVTAAARARNGLAVLAGQLQSCKTVSWKEICDAQDRLIATGRIVEVEMGPPSKRYVYLRPSDMRLPGENPQTPDATEEP